MPSFFFHKLQLITVLLLICDSYMSWSTRLASLKLCVGFSIFDSVSFLLKFIFLFGKMHGFFDFQNQANRKITHSFAPRPLIFKLQQEVLNLMISAWVGTHRQNRPGDKFFKLTKSKFWEHQFFSVVSLEQHMTLAKINL